MSAPPPRTTISYLGHAGFVVEHSGTRILIDPWFFPAFLGAWFPLPDNRFLLSQVLETRFDFLYISHTHEDHFDKQLLSSLDRSVTVIVPEHRSKALSRKLSALGFERQLLLGHKASVELASGLIATIFLDTSHKEDSALLLELDGFRFLDLNDCNTSMSELPQTIDLLAAQFSGAQWYPDCYDFPPEVMRNKVRQVRSDLLDTLIRKVSITQARNYLPSAGPACFLDSTLRHLNERAEHIFPIWEDVAAAFGAQCPHVRVLKIQPGDKLTIDADRRCASTDPASSITFDREYFDAYAERRRVEWGEFHKDPGPDITAADLASHFTDIQQHNRHLLQDFSKLVRLVAGSQCWAIRLGQFAEDFVIEGEGPLDPEYTLIVPPRVLSAILAGEVGWEEAFLSMRVRLSRTPDAFDARFMGLLRYGNEPAQTLHMAREAEQFQSEMIERDGLRMQRYCPHAGEDLTHAIIGDGIIECPRHHWKWDSVTGRCIAGGIIALKVEPSGSIDGGAPLEPANDLDRTTQ